MLSIHFFITQGYPFPDPETLMFLRDEKGLSDPSASVSPLAEARVESRALLCRVIKVNSRGSEMSQQLNALAIEAWTRVQPHKGGRRD